MPPLSAARLLLVWLLVWRASAGPFAGRDEAGAERNNHEQPKGDALRPADVVEVEQVGNLVQRSLRLGVGLDVDNPVFLEPLLVADCRVLPPVFKFLERLLPAA